MKNRVDLMINKDCNIDCLFCYHHGFHDTSAYDFSETKIKSILLYGKLHGLTELYISWWEPTISNNLDFSLSTAKEYGYKRVKIMTNGLKFSDENYCEKLKNLWVTNIAVSMHWYNAEIFELHANVRWTFPKFIKGLRNLVRYFDTEVNIVLTNKNIESLNKHIKLLLTLWVKRVHLQHIVPNSQVNKELLPTSEMVKIYVNDFLEKFGDKINVTLEFFPYCLIKEKKYLWMFSFENDFVTNNIQMFDNWSEWILKNKVVKEQCKGCSYYENCQWFWSLN